MLSVVATLFGTLFGLLAGGVWIGLTLAITGTLMLALFRSIPLDKLLPQYACNILTTQELLALPLFIVMGELLFRTHLSRALFTGLAPWAGLLPGRLLHVNVLGCSIFAAISGSSAATTQVVGRMALAELLKRGYTEQDIRKILGLNVLRVMREAERVSMELIKKRGPSTATIRLSASSTA